VLPSTRGQDNYRKERTREENKRFVKEFMGGPVNKGAEDIAIESEKKEGMGEQGLIGRQSPKL